MNLTGCGALGRGSETRVWYRAIQAGLWQTALQTVQTQQVPSRYHAGAAASQPFEVLYLAEE